MSICRVRVQVEDAPEFFFRTGPIPIVEELDPSKGGMRLGQRFIQLEGTHRGGLCQRVRFSRKHYSVPGPNPTVRTSQASVRQRIARVELNRLLKQCNGSVQGLRGKLVCEEDALEVGLVRLWVYTAGACQPTLFLRCERDLDLLGHRLRYVTVQQQHVTHVTVVRI